ncbi:MAG: PD40 domain-containing protein, partial [Ignavibacteriae bacterium]|nr:PD40 domain-containing protein [Ignavibacteriota bacterium]
QEIYSQEEKPENLGPTINSDGDELMPVISPDGKTIYFCRGDFEANYGKQDIWYSVMDETGKWSPSINMGPPLNDEYNNFVISVTPDGNTLLLGNVYKTDGTVERGISISHRTADGWTFPEKVNVEYYYNQSDYSSFYLANDGMTLLMSVQREDSYGEKDIYVSFLQPNGEFTEPMNLGPTINSTGDESTPFLASDGVSLYFSSTGHGGYGNSDVYFSRRVDSNWTNWKSAKNLGPSINTSGSDLYLKLSAAGDFAYFVSTENSFGKGDIFRIRLPETLRPLPVLLIHGKVISKKSRTPIEAMISYDRLPDKLEAGIARSDHFGNYKIVLPAGYRYRFHAKADGYFTFTDSLDLRFLSLYTELERDIELIPLEDSIMCFRNILFNSGKSALFKESIIELEKIVKFMGTYEDINLDVYAHCDSVGGEEMNQILSERRSNEVTNYLFKRGIDPSRVQSEGFGEMRPLWSNTTPEGRQYNRRVEFKVWRNIHTYFF